MAEREIKLVKHTDKWNQMTGNSKNECAIKNSAFGWSILGKCDKSSVMPSLKNLQLLRGGDKRDPGKDG